MRRAWLLLLALGAAACSSGNNAAPRTEPSATSAGETGEALGPDTGDTGNPRTEVGMDEPQTICKNMGDIEAAIGKTCTVVGTLEVREFRNPKGIVFREWPVVVLEDGRDVLVESLWHQDRKPDTGTIERLRGQRVAVTGPLHGQPPGSISNIAVPTVSPVSALGPADP